MTLAGASHHALLEDTGAYLSALGGFRCESDARTLCGDGSEDGDAEDGDATSGLSDALNDLEIELQRVRLQMREEEDSLTGELDLDDSATWAAETEVLRARTAKSKAGAIAAARKSSRAARRTSRGPPGGQAVSASRVVSTGWTTSGAQDSR